MITEEEHHIMAHARAWYAGRYRNRFVTDSSTTAWPIIQALCERGLMQQLETPDYYEASDRVFRVTAAGEGELREYDEAKKGEATS